MIYDTLVAKFFSTYSSILKLAKLLCKCMGASLLVWYLNGGPKSDLETPVFVDFMNSDAIFSY